MEEPIPGPADRYFRVSAPDNFLVDCLSLQSSKDAEGVEEQDPKPDAAGEHPAGSSSFFQDVRLVCSGGICLRSHRLVLGALSPIFQEALLTLKPGEEEESGEFVIIAPDVDATDMQTFLSKLFQPKLEEDENVVVPSLEWLDLFDSCNKSPSNFCWKTANTAVGTAATAKDASILPDSAPNDARTGLAADNEKDSQESSKNEEPQSGKMRTRRAVAAAAATTTAAAGKVQAKPKLDQTDFIGFEPEAMKKGAPMSVQKKPSMVWEYFLKNSQAGMVQCKVCGAVYKLFGSSTSTLLKHLRKVHPELVPSTEEFEDSGLMSGSDLQKSIFGGLGFGALDDGRKKAKASPLTPKRPGPGRPRGSSAAVVKAEGIEGDDTDDDDDDDDEDYVAPKSALADDDGRRKSQGRGPRKQSVVWKFFKVVDGGGKGSKEDTFMSCKKCEATYKVKGGTTTSLIRHLKNNHAADLRKWTGGSEDDEEDEDVEMEESTEKAVTKKEPMEVDDDDGDEDDDGGAAPEGSGSSPADDKGSKKQSLVWNFFDKVDDERVQCRICSKSYSAQGGSTSSLLKHIRKEHNDDHHLMWNKEGHSKEEGLDDASAASAKKSNRILRKNVAQGRPKRLNKKAAGRLFGAVVGGGSSRLKLRKKDPIDLEAEDEYGRRKGCYMFRKRQQLVVVTGASIRRSLAWNFFQKVAEDTVECKVCSNIYIVRGGTTTSLMKHLKAAHASYCRAWEKENLEAFDAAAFLDDGTHPIWNHFVFCVDDKEQIGQCWYECKHCCSKVEAVGDLDPNDQHKSHRQSLSELEAHLQDKHKEDYGDFVHDQLMLTVTKKGDVLGVAPRSKTSRVAVIGPDGADGSVQVVVAENPDAEQQQLGGGDILEVVEVIGSSEKGVTFLPKYLKCGLTNLLAADFFTHLQNKIFLCVLCSAATKVPNAGHTSGMPLWFHLQSCHQDIHEKLVEERARIASSMALLQLPPDHPISTQFDLGPDPSIPLDSETVGGGVGPESWVLLCKVCFHPIPIGKGWAQLQEHLTSKHPELKAECGDVDVQQMVATEKWLSSHVMPGLPGLLLGKFFSCMKTNEDPDEAALELRCQICEEMVTADRVVAHLKEMHLQELQSAIQKESSGEDKKRPRRRAVKTEDDKDDENKTGENNGGDDDKDNDDDDDEDSENHVVNPGECFCRQCGATFMSVTAEKAHVRLVHEGVESPYKCDICFKAFRRTDDLRKHKKRHKGLQDDADPNDPSGKLTSNHLCARCGKTFSGPGQLLRHVRFSHLDIRPHSCSECGKSFHTTQQLRRHERIHTGEKPHQCTECGRQFTVSTQLKSHMNTHTGDAPIRCPTCPMRFRHYSSRIKHKCPGRR